MFAVQHAGIPAMKLLATLLSGTSLWQPHQPGFGKPGWQGCSNALPVFVGHYIHRQSYTVCMASAMLMCIGPNADDGHLYCL